MNDNEKLIESVRDWPTITRMSHSTQLEKLVELRDALEAAEKALTPADEGYASAHDDLPWEYSPGHRWVDRDGEEHWFVQSGVIAPGYVSTYIEEGGAVVRRLVGPYEEFHGTKEEM